MWRWRRGRGRCCVSRWGLGLIEWGASTCLVGREEGRIGEQLLSRWCIYFGPRGAYAKYTASSSQNAPSSTIFAFLATSSCPEQRSRHCLDTLPLNLLPSFLPFSPFFLSSKIICILSHRSAFHLHGVWCLVSSVLSHHLFTALSFIAYVFVIVGWESCTLALI